MLSKCIILTTPTYKIAMLFVDLFAGRLPHFLRPNYNEIGCTSPRYQLCFSCTFNRVQEVECCKWPFDSTDEQRDSWTGCQDVVVTYPSVGERAYAFDTCIPARVDGTLFSSAQFSRLSKCFSYAYGQFSTLWILLAHFYIETSTANNNSTLSRSSFQLVCISRMLPIGRRSGKCWEYA